LAELERRGLVIRSRHPSDKRVVHARLSAEAFALMNNILGDFFHMFGPTINRPLGSDDQSTLSFERRGQ
jgi:DNA-binding MarR family transcriptional regulator